MVFIIGEIGTNHAGSIKIAKKIIDAAVDAGFNAVKFQKKDIEQIYTKEFLDSYLESPWGTTQREMRLYREFSDKQFQEIDKYCKKKKIACIDLAMKFDGKLEYWFDEIHTTVLCSKIIANTVIDELVEIIDNET